MIACVKIISYATETFSDVSSFVGNFNVDIKIERIDPDRFLKTDCFENTDFWLNLVTKDLQQRQQISEKITAQKLKRFTFVHPTAYVGKNCLSPGCVIYPNVTIYDSATLSNDIIVHSNSRISHSAKIGTGTFVGGIVNICGSSEIGSFCVLAPNCVILDHVFIADRCKIMPGSIVRKNIIESGSYLITAYGQRKKITHDI